MRNLLVILLVCGIAFLGYEVLQRRPGAMRPAAVQAAAKRPLSGPAHPAEPAALAAAQAGPAAPAAARPRWAEALLGGDLRGLELDLGRRDDLAPGTGERFAFEVAVALGGDPDRAGLGRSASALAGQDGVRETGALLAAGVRVLAEAGLADAAVAAMGGNNRFLGAAAAADAQQALLAAAGALRPEAEARVLSAYLDRMTRGPVLVWKKGFRLLGEGYAALQRVLRTVVFRRSGSWKSRFYDVKKGDSLARIAADFEREFHIPMSAGLLQRINGIRDPARLQAGIRLRIPLQELRVVVEKSTFSMKVFLGDLLIRLYDVGLGKAGCTPEATFIVTEKQYRPVWTHPETGEQIAAGDPRNLIGDYFLALGHADHRGYGIHGTRDQASIGRQSSLGCIRLREKDMRAVFSYLPRRTKVVVRR